jgi:hypothetical protein
VTVEGDRPSGRALTTPSLRRHNLPAQRTPPIGREQEADAVHRLLLVLGRQVVLA